MSACIARAKGFGLCHTSESSRPGTLGVEAQANTFNTYTTSTVNADGSGSMTVERIVLGERRVIGTMSFTAEAEAGFDTVLFSPTTPFGEVARA